MAALAFCTDVLARKSKARVLLMIKGHVFPGSVIVTLQTVLRKGLLMNVSMALNALRGKAEKCFFLLVTFVARLLFMAALQRIASLRMIKTFCRYRHYI